MPNDDYDLDVLLELRHKERDEAEKRYAEACKRHEELQKEVERLQQNYQTLVEERERECLEFDDKLVSGPQTAVRVQEFDRYVAGLRQQEEEMLARIDQIRQKRRRAEQEMEDANDEMLESIRQLKAVEKHHENWQKEQAVAAKRREAAKMDDIATRMWREGK